MDSYVRARDCLFKISRLVVALIFRHVISPLIYMRTPLQGQSVPQFIVRLYLVGTESVFVSQNVDLNLEL